MAGVARPMYTSITRKLTAALAPVRLAIVDESHLHRGHAGVRHAQGPETHFKVEVVSQHFAQMPRTARQRAVYTLLADEFNQGLHALQLSCRSPEEEARASPAASQRTAPSTRTGQRRPSPDISLPAWAEEIGTWIDTHNPVLLDVRTSHEVKAQPVHGAVHIPIDELDERAEDLLDVTKGPDCALGAFCAAGVRSERAVHILKAKGFTNLRNVHSAAVLHALGLPGQVVD